MATITGSENTDLQLYGTANNDTIIGYGSSDHLFGFGGNDTLYGDYQPNDPNARLLLAGNDN
ncbi:hypothetical protein F7734_14785 [Scytonema sp. UIC 10036]|uniref:hypothetical protein n=1 Tax=Scytonema sp. UIC 10036 TaxID=2304196 RepID=UPI0012DA6399|nr:hypothetical protein [Scytonema sp. UIC 10036]MUG93621.1 hypothetical protein [Scytonema sp. UIC 10036]